MLSQREISSTPLLWAGIIILNPTAVVAYSRFRGKPEELVVTVQAQENIAEIVRLVEGVMASEPTLQLRRQELVELSVGTAV